MTESTPPAGAPAPAIVLNDAAVRIGDRTIWSGVNLCVDQGEFVAVLGPNGAGKSTLIKVMVGLLALSSGEIKILGQPPGHARHNIGYLPQRRSFDSSMRIRGVDVVRLGIDGDRWGVPLPGLGRVSERERRARARIEKVIDQVGASAYADRPIGELSGGEQQRLLIAQALVTEPQVLLLDEPLDSLDLPNQASVASLIDEICEDQGVTVVIVAHDVNPILSYLDWVVYLAGGKVLCGSPSEVITDKNLTRLYGTEIEVLTASDGRLVVVGEPHAPAHHTDRHTGAPIP